MKAKRLAAAMLALGLLSSFSAKPLVSLSDTAIKAVEKAKEREANAGRSVTLKVYNWAEYILPDMTADEAASQGYDPAPIDGINTRFKAYMKAEKNIDVNVVYDNFSTNEDMINQLRTGKIDYDLVAPSDYAIQRLMADNLVIPFDNEAEYPGSTPNYDKYASPWLISELSGIKAKDMYTATKADPDIDSSAVEAEPNVINRFARGYMWGTVGMTYNPDFSIFKQRGISQDKLNQDIQSWEILWNTDYAQTAYVKDSVRDGYAAGMQHAFYPESMDLKAQYDNGTLSASDYNQKLTELLNRTDDEALLKASEAIQSMSQNLYGFETDNGKEEIQTGKTIGITQQYSGDAVYSIKNADALGLEKLYYSLPDSGSNIWFDGWVMTRNALTHGVTDVAQDYVDFLDNPSPESDKYDMGPAVANMDYIGYTPFIASDEVFSYVRDSYDLRANEDEPNYDELPQGKEGTDYLVKDLSYFFKGTGDLSDYKIYYAPEEKNRALDALYIDEAQIPHLIIYADFGDRTGNVTDVWEQSRSLQFPVWGYWLVLAILFVGIAAWVLLWLRHETIRKRRKERIARMILASNQGNITQKQLKAANKVVQKANDDAEKEKAKAAKKAAAEANKAAKKR